MREYYLHAIAKYNGEPTRKVYCYPQLANMYPDIPGHILNATERLARKKWSQHAKEVLSSKVSLPTFKQDLSIHLHNKGYKVQNTAKNYIIDAQLRSQGHEPTRYQFIIAANDKSTKTILDRIINGEYKQGEALITKDRKNNFFFIIPYTFTVDYHDIEKTNIMGIDLGITKAAYWTFSGSYKRGWIAGSEIEENRRRVQNRRIEIQNQGKYCGDGRIGHGTSRRLLPIDVVSEKETNFRVTCNYRYARHIVDEALKMRCGIIQMEDLRTINSNINKKDKFLKNWTYFDLQTKIINKAAEYGIEVRKVNPQYTSKRCSNCGHIDKANRPNQATFICTACSYGNLHHCLACGATQKASGICEKCGEPTKRTTINADYNAARNLTIEGIEEIIISTLAANGLPLILKKNANYKHTQSH